MFITRENFEKAFRRAKAEGRREAEKEFAIKDSHECMERNIYNCINQLEDRTVKRLERIEREIGEIHRPTEALKGKCECLSEPKMPIENPVR